MAVFSQVYYGYAGANFITAPELTYITVLGVKRQGFGFVDSEGASPGNREFKYTPASGKVEFQNDFIGEVDPGSQVDTAFESIFVLYRT